MFAGETADANALISIGTGLRPHQVRRFHQVHTLTHKPRGGIEAEERPEGAGIVPGFLPQLPSGRFERSFVRLDTARHEFPQTLACRIAKLAHQDNSPVVEVRQHDYRAWMQHHLAVDGHAARLDHSIELEAYDTALVECLAAENLGLRFHKIG